MSEHGEYLAWDTSKRGPAKELPSCVIASHMGGMRYGGATLSEFVARCLSEQEVQQVVGPGYTPLSATFELLPVGQRRR